MEIEQKQWEKPVLKKMEVAVTTSGPVAGGKKKDGPKGAKS